MTLSFSLLLLSASVPDVVVGPALVEQARAADLPIQTVTVFSDRAQVSRGGTVTVQPGVQAFRLSDLPGAALTDTVRLSAEGVTVVRLEVNPVLRERVSIDSLDQVVTTIEALQAELVQLERQMTVYSSEIALLGNLAPKALPDEEWRLGAKVSAALAPAVWQATFGFIEARRSKDQGTLTLLGTKRRAILEKLHDARREAARLNVGGLTDRKLEVVAILDAKQAGAAKLSLDYFITGASWLPVYDVRFAPDQGKVTLETAGLVGQATGESWTDVAMLLSTAIPGQGIDLPELLTWTLGEQRELILQPHARVAPPHAPRFTMPRPTASEHDLTTSARREVLQQRLAALNRAEEQRAQRPQQQGISGESSGLDFGGESEEPTAPSSTSAREPEQVVYKKHTVVDFGDDTIDGDLSKPDGAFLMSRKVRRDEPAPPPATVSAPSGDSAKVSVLGAAGGVSQRSRSGEQSPSFLPLALSDGTVATRPIFSDPNLPAVIAGGFDYVYRVATRTDVSSTNVKTKVPLRALSFPVTTFYEASPALMPVAFLKARVENREGQAVLRGRANIFVDGSFVSEGTLETTGPGGKLELPLGADENIKLVRRVVPATTTEGVFSKKDVTTYEVTIEVASFKKTAVKVEVIDQIPKTGQTDIEIAYLGSTPAQREGPDADGILRWEVTVAPGKTTKLVFKYQIKRPKDWQLQPG